MLLKFSLVITLVLTQDPNPSLRHIELPEDIQKPAGPLDWVYEKLDIKKDVWRSEGLTEDIGKLFKDMASQLKKTRLDENYFSDFFTSDFKGASPLPRKEIEVYKSPELVAHRGVEEKNQTKLGTSAWLTEFSKLHQRFQSITKAHFKVFRIDPVQERSTKVSTGVLLEMDGRTHKGFYLQIRCIWDLKWATTKNKVKLQSMELTSFDSTLLYQRSFSDVTEKALGNNRAYREHLVHGVPYWRTRIDSASGIDVYGHQGIAVGDFDGDGWEDFYVPQPAGLPNRLLHNLGDGRFEDVTTKAGVDILDETGSALFLDLDNDGDNDLVVTTGLEVLMFENDGHGRFRRQERSGLQSAMSSSSSTLGCSAADYDRDGDIDLYIFSYIFWAGRGSKLQSTYPVPYHNANNGAPNFLFRNDGDLHFTDVTRAIGMDQNNSRFTLAASWCDFDRDGDPDLYVANDFGKNNLYLNEGRKFRDIGAELGVEDIGNGMSVDWCDYDNDGRFDLYVGNMWSSAGQRMALQTGFITKNELRQTYQRMTRGNTLLRNNGNGRFEDVSESSGARFGRWSWSSLFVDFDANGHEDLYVLNGFISNEKKVDL